MFAHHPSLATSLSSPTDLQLMCTEVCDLLLVAGDLDAVLGAEPDGGGASCDGVVVLFRKRGKKGKD